MRCPVWFPALFFFQVTFIVDRSGGEGSSEDIEVELVKKPGKGLGLSVVGRRNGTGVFISDMVRNAEPSS